MTKERRHLTAVTGTKFVDVRITLYIGLPKDSLEFSRILEIVKLNVLTPPGEEVTSLYTTET